MNVPGFLVAFLYLFGGLFVLFGIVIAGLSIAAPFAFAVNMLDARRVVVDYLGWLPYVHREAEYVGAAALALSLLAIGGTMAALGTLMMALPGLA